MAQTGAQQPTFADLELLSEVSQLLTLLDLDRVLQRAIRLAAKSVGASKASLFLHDEFDVDWGHIFVTRDMTPDESVRVVRKVLDKGLAGWVLRHRQAAIVHDAETDERWYVFPDDDYKVGSALCVPLMMNQQVLAVVTLVHPEKNHFTEYHLRLLMIIANQATIAIRNAQLFNRLQAQQRQLETVLQAIPDVLFVLDVNGHILMINDAAAEFLGEQTAANIIGKHLGAYSSTSSTLLPIFEAAQNDTPGTGAPWAFEVRSERKKRDYQVVISVWRDVVHGLEGYVVAMHDVTTLRDLSRFKDEMLRIASHDLRTPLALIAGYADLISIDLDPQSTTQEHLEVIRRSTERMNGLLDDLLRVEQVKRSPLELHEEVDLGALAAEVVAETRPLVARKNQELSADLQTAALPGVVVDRALLRRAMENLITNASKYTPEGGHIRVRASAADGRFHFSVEDDGIGIPPEHLPHIFESFYRVKDARAGNVPGFGLGLNLVRTIIERHKGEVWVESQVGIGSKFGFELPLK
ncbi:MAG: GAF domain-containing protein [Chloroflexi bacterium]|nr:GAF domain-containing protein [Chloroflexota bacterium]